MSLKYALLGFLNYSAMTGYELKQRFDQSVQHFWRANLSQIYPSLIQMVNEGLLEMEVEYQESRPNRKVYRITEHGRRDLLGWLEEPLGLQPVREPFLIKIFFGASLEKDKFIALLENQLLQHRERLATYHSITENIPVKVPTGEPLREAFFWNLTLEAGKKHEIVLMEWLEEAIKHFGSMEGDTGM